MNTVFHGRMQCQNALYIRTFIKQSLEKVKNTYSMNDYDIYELKLILNELISNAFLHGNKRDSWKEIELIIDRIDSYSLRICVRDQGAGFNYQHLLSEFNSNKKNEILNEHGRGLLIVSKLCENIVFNEKGNQIEIVKRIQK